MVTADSIKNHIERSMPCELVHVEGDDGHHFSAIIVSAEFRGKKYGAAASAGLSCARRQDEAGDPCVVHENANARAMGGNRAKLGNGEKRNCFRELLRKLI